MDTFFSLVLLLIFSRAEADPSITWEPQEVVANQMDDVTVTCVVTGADFIDVVRVEQVVGEKRRVLTLNSGLKRPYSLAEEKYSVNFEWSAEEARLTINFKEILGRETGHLVCDNLMAPSVKEAVLNLKVQAPITELYLGTLNKTHLSPLNKTHVPNPLLLTRTSQETPATGGDSAPLLVCYAKVDGSSEPPQLEMRVEGRVIKGEEGRESTVKEWDAGKGFYRVVSGESSVGLDLGDAELDGKEVKCVSSVEGFEAMVASTVLHIMHEPIILCENTIKKVTIGENVTLSCFVKANPKADIYWVSTDDESHHEQIYKEDTEDNRTSVVLSILGITEKQLKHGYVINATNEVGSKILRFSFDKAMPASFVKPASYEVNLNSEATSAALASTLLICFQILFCCFLFD